MFSAVRRASTPDFMFCPPGLVFDGTEGFGSRFHVLHARTHFRRSRGRWFPFSYFARSGSFWTVPSASGLVFMFCAPELIFGGTEGVQSFFMFFALKHVFSGPECVGSHFHVLHDRICFQRNRGRRVPFSCLAFPDSFLVVTRASGQVFMF
jgi:hypothetical protein